MIYNPDTCTVELGVRSLCALAMRSGDLDFRRGGTRALINGADIHRRLQAEAGGYYNPEVSLSCTTLFEGMYYTVSGRADGIIRTDEGLIVDEIKCVSPYAFSEKPTEAHLAQLKCYAYFLCVRDDLGFVRARLTYFNTDSKKIKYFNFTLEREKLKAFYLGLLEKIKFYAELCAKRTLEVLPAAANAVFPYTGLREGQQMMMRECFGAIKHGDRLFLEAPTGTGKTISSLYPAMRALGTGYVDKIFYLTAKASVRREAYAAASKLFSTGVGIRAITLSAKEQMCACREKSCDANMCTPDRCARAAGYYDRLDGALRELLTTANGYPAKTIRLCADKYGICPYELSLDLSELCDIIICDYNYAFDPSVYLHRYFGEGGRREKYVFLIDEAHNLADRARDMYSAQLNLSDFLRVSARGGECERLLCDVTGKFASLRRLCKDTLARDAGGTERGFFISSQPLEGFCEQLLVFKKKCDTFLRKNPDYEHFDELYALCSSVRKYLCVNEYFDKGFLCFLEVCGEDIYLKTFCRDPSRVMNTLLCRAVSSVMFSATLAPMEYFCDVLGCSGSAVCVSLPSPFDSERLSVSIVDKLSLRYSDRAENIRKYVSIIAATVSVRAGNYLVYFPSYDCLEKVYKVFSLKYPRVQTVVQKKGMTPKEREEFLLSFKDDTERLRIGFCVLGGMFAEGVDLPGSRLIGTVIFGVGLPGLSNERNIIKEYFDEDSGRGYEYAYTYPGMNNVLQAAGRVIRSESDRGVVVLVDDRYASPEYRRLFPTHWKNIQYAGNAASLAEILRRFWKNGG